MQTVIWDILAPTANFDAASTVVGYTKHATKRMETVTGRVRQVIQDQGVIRVRRDNSVTVRVHG